MHPERVVCDVALLGGRVWPPWLLECCRLKLVPLVERLAREEDDYMRVRDGVWGRRQGS
jgi:hypothetical protein